MSAADRVRRAYLVLAELAQAPTGDQAEDDYVTLRVEACSILYDLAVAEDAARRSVAW